MGQLLPRHAELDGPASRPSLRRGRSGRVHAARRGRRLPRAIRGRVRGARARGRRGDVAPTRRGRRLRARHVRRPAAGDDGGRGHGRLPAAAPAGRSHAAGDHATARRRRLSQSGGAGPRRRPHRRQRSVGLPDRRGAHRGRPRGLSRVRARPLDAAPHRRSRPALVGAGDRLPRRCRERTARSVGAAVRQHPRDRARRRARPPPPHAPTARRDAAGAFPRRRRSGRPLRARPRGQRRLGGSAPRGLHATRSPACGRTRHARRPRSRIRSRSRTTHPSELDLRRLGAVSSRADSGRTTRPGCDCPGAFDDLGFPIHARGREHGGRGVVLPRHRTSCASASPRCSSASARTRRSSPQDRGDQRPISRSREAVRRAAGPRASPGGTATSSSRAPGRSGTRVTATRSHSAAESVVVPNGSCRNGT